MNLTDKPNTLTQARLPYEPEGITFSQVITKIVANWKWFMGLALAGVIISFIYYKFTSPYYKIYSTILVKNDGKSFDMNNVFNAMNSTPKNPIIKDQVGVLKSYNLNFRTLQYFNWRYSWYLKEWFLKKDLYGNDPFTVIQTDDATQTDNVPLTIIPLSENEYLIECDEKIKVNGIEKVIEFKSQLKFGEQFKNEYFQFALEKNPEGIINIGAEYILIFNNINLMALAYKERLEVMPADVTGNSNLINIELVTSNLSRDVDYLNQLGKIYIQFGLDEKNRMANNTIKFIDDQISGVDLSLQLAGDQFSSFRARNRTVDLGKEATSVVEKLKAIELERSTLDMKLDYYNNLKFYLDNRDQNKDLVAPSIVGVTDEALSSNVLKLNELYTRREVLSYTAQERNPLLISLNNEITYTQKALRENVDNLISNTKVELQNLNDRQRSINSELSRLPKTEQDLIGIKRTFDLNNELYTFLLQRRAEAEIAKASNNPDAQILDPTANEISERIGPLLILNLLIGLFGGILFAVGLVVIKEFVSDLLTDVEDIAKRLDVSIIGFIATNKHKTEMPVRHHPRSAVAESFRGLRVNLEHFFKETQSKVLAVHSYISGEGKSFVAFNLALIFAMGNRKVLLVDGDMRRPRLHKILGQDIENGLSNFLDGSRTLNAIIRETKIENLSFVASGSVHVNSSELLNNGMIEIFLKEASAHFDYIIIDNSPIGVVHDPVIVGTYADFNLVLLRLHVSKKAVINAINKIGNDGLLKRVVVAINGIKQSHGYGYYTDESRHENKVSKSPKKEKVLVSLETDQRS